MKNIREFVDQVLLLRGSCPIDECEISLLDFEDQDMPSINHWIRHIVMCKVQVLKLRISRVHAEPWLQLDEQPLFSRHLTRLKLFDLWFNDNFVDLSHCPPLEELEINGCYLAYVDGISSQSLKHLSIGSCTLGQSFRSRIYVPNLISLQLDLDFDRVPMLEEMPSLQEASIEIQYSEFDMCFDSNSGNCVDELCEFCYEIKGDKDSSVLLQGLSKAKNLALICNMETVQLPFIYHHFHVSVFFSHFCYQY